VLMHMVLCRWERALSAEDLASVREGFDALSAIQYMRHVEHGADLGLPSHKYDYAMVGWFDDADGLARYIEHPLHRALVRDVLDAFGATRAISQIEVPALPCVVE
jgi:hypothetical protein